MVTPKFGPTSLSLHAELKSRVNTYFRRNHLNSTGSYKLYIKAAIMVLGYTAIYIHLVFFTPVTWLAICECILLGVLTSGIGFNVMHDGSHGSFSKHTWVNTFAALTLDMLGASSFMWNTKHNIVHHAYTNIGGIDDDLDAGVMLRLCDTQPRHKIHRYQHRYFWFLYSLLYFVWVFYKDYKKYFSNKVGNVPLKKLQRKDHIIFWTSKVLHLFFYIALPIYMCGVVPWLIGFLIYCMVGGFIMSIVFQLAHTIDEASFPRPEQPANRIEDEWALHQLKTTANFATKNKFITWWVGGLNYQIEHHLFPKISHVHYPTISRIIKQVCEEMGVPYIEHRKMTGAISSHVAYLKKLGAHT